MNIQDIVSQALQQDVPLTTLEIDSLLQQVVQEQLRLQRRFDKINSTGRGTQGPEYRQMLLMGTAEDVADMKAECNRLVIEREQLRAKEDTLRQRRLAALTNEAMQNLPDLQQALVDRIEVAEKAQQALEAAFVEIDTTYMAIVQARAQCNMGAVQPTAGALPETIQRLERLSHFSAVERVSTSRRGGHASNLGLEHIEKAVVQSQETATPATWAAA